MYFLLKEEELHLKKNALEETPDRPGTSSRRPSSLSLYYYTKEEQGYAYYMGVELCLGIMP